LQILRDVAVSAVVSLVYLQKALVLSFALVVASVWIQASTAGKGGRKVPARVEKHHLDDVLSELYGPPIPHRDIVNEEAQELRKSRDPTAQNIYVEQFIFIDLPADVPYAHKVYKRILPELTDYAPRKK
jgi:hypothetical protein